jgi:hypothetical protein
MALWRTTRYPRPTTAVSTRPHTCMSGFKRQLATAPLWSDELWERMVNLLGPPTPLGELRLAAALVLRTHHRDGPAPQQPTARSKYLQQGVPPPMRAGPGVIVALEPLGPAAHHPPESRFEKPSAPSRQPQPPAHRRSKAELVAENDATGRSLSWHRVAASRWGAGWWSGGACCRIRQPLVSQEGPGCIGMRPALPGGRRGCCPRYDSEHGPLVAVVTMR